MLRSMTGFASKTIEIKNDQKDVAYLTLSLKSLNARFFEASCKLPLPLQSLEIPLVTLLKNNLYRGKISFTIQVSNPTIFKSAIQFSLPMAKSYLDALHQIQKTLQVKGEITASELLLLPSVLVLEDKEADSALKDFVMKKAQEVIEQLIISEEQEGKELRADILERWVLLNTIIDQIEKHSTILLEQKKQTLEQKINEINQDKRELIELYYNNLLLELEKADIHEEIVRFKSHLKNMRDIVEASSIEKGRHVDFTVQELLRETNTIAAKCADSHISSYTITLKVELEKIREQIQNVV